ncbi:MAG: PQQ-dependent sugar dehydrogenase [Myxococcales bacterium]|nr:PQQ-dependent sugar dehydrogenase [Myxococcales bacterium]
MATLLLLLSWSGCGDDDSTDVDASVPTDAPATDAPATDAPATDDASTDGGAPTECATTPIPNLRLEPLLSSGGFDSPLFVTAAPGDADTLYVIEKPGRVIVVRNRQRVGTFIDLTNEPLLTSGEQGLLGLAFHPDYASNGRFFLFFTPGTGDADRRNVVAEFRRSAGNPDRADRAEVARLVDVRDRESNHNGGMLAFGPDGYLYVAMGDEGGGGDRHGMIGNGLDRTTLFGSILRLDVDAEASGYAAPGNPFTLPTGQPQIWAYGVRNPWRMSFDRATGDLWVADVGQDLWEEITILPAGTAPGANLGWRAYEGLSVFDANLVDLVPEHAAPQLVYRHNDDSQPAAGNSITGGYVYRGGAIPALRGWYLYGDFGSPHVGAVRFCDGDVTDHVRAPGLSFGGSGLASFGEDGRGELLVVYLQSGVFRVLAE